MTSDERLTRDFFLGFIRVHILHHACEAPIYGVAMIEELRRHDYVLSPGTLYPVLRDLEGSGYLAKEHRNVDGRVRKYYTITPAGETALVAARVRIRELVQEVMGSV